jgi:UDP-N-acetylmuramoyl-tripeptide--D-alanyl-D-alanine ligase
MIKRSLKEIFNMAGGIELLEPEHSYHESDIHGVSIDSRTINHGNLFIPIIRVDDGHKYVVKAFENGAIASLWQKDHGPPPTGSPIIMVEDTLKALHHIAKAYRSQLSCKVIGITGSNGKTTVKDMISSILETEHKVKKTFGNLNGEYGLPLSILEVEEDTEVAILEMGMSNLGEIELLSEIAKPDIAIITMIGVSHLSSLGSREGIAHAKLEILEGLNPKGALIINGDEPLLTQGLQGKTLPSTLKIITFGESETNDYFLTEIQIDESQTDIVFSINTYNCRFQLPLLGNHNIFNAMAAIAVAELFGTSIEHIQLGLLNLNISAMRMEKIQSKKGFLIINDAWNASPVSVKAAIQTLQNLEGYNKKILVLGDMLELGESENQFHIEIAQSIDVTKIHSVYTYGDLSKIITDTLNESSLNGDAIHFLSKDDLASECLRILEHNDVVLVKGSRGLKLEEVCDILMEIPLKESCEDDVEKETR